MEDMASLWSYEESLDELKHKLLYTTLELETVRAQANEEMTRNKHSVSQLWQLLKTTCKERDEARLQIQNLLNKFIPPCGTTPTEIFASLPQVQPESPMIKPRKANSSITESNSLSDTHSYQSPNNPFFDVVSSPEPSNINNMADSSNLGYVNQPFVDVDQGCLVIEKFVKGKTLPQKGKLLQAVVEAGPLLKTLLLAGPLPRWRNPPPIQTLQIPHVSIKGCDSEIVKPVENLGQVHKSPNKMSFPEMSCGSLTHFRGGSSCLESGRLISADVNASSNYASSGKRQRLL